MTQRIFDVENEKDMQDLWDIFPDDIEKLSPIMGIRVRISAEEGCSTETNLLAINWHDKTEITRPIQEATEQDLGKLCVFWSYDKSEYEYGILTDYYKDNDCKYVRDKRMYLSHCRRLTKQEIEELC